MCLTAILTAVFSHHLLLHRVLVSRSIFIAYGFWWIGKRSRKKLFPFHTTFIALCCSWELPNQIKYSISDLKWREMERACVCVCACVPVQRPNSIITATTATWIDDRRWWYTRVSDQRKRHYVRHDFYCTRNTAQAHTLNEAQWSHIRCYTVASVYRFAKTTSINLRSSR